MQLLTTFLKIFFLCFWSDWDSLPLISDKLGSSSFVDPSCASLITQLCPKIHLQPMFSSFSVPSLQGFQVLLLFQVTPLCRCSQTFTSSPTYLQSCTFIFSTVCWVTSSRWFSSSFKCSRLKVNKLSSPPSQPFLLTSRLIFVKENMPLTLK